MSAPGIPSTVAVAAHGFVDHTGGAKKALLLTWGRPPGPPSPTEHFEIHFDDDVDHPSTPFSRIDIATADLVLAQVVDLYDCALAPTLDGDETLKIRAVNTDGASSYVTVTSDFDSALTLPPTEAADMAQALTVAVGSLGETTATATWSHSDPKTRASHWILRLTHAGTLVAEISAPFWATSKAITGLEPGKTYALQIFARYRSNNATVFDGDALPETPLEFTTTAAGLELEGPSSLSTTVGGLIGAAYDLGTAVSAWRIVNGPPGVTIESVDDYSATLAGSPTASGMYDATVQALNSALSTVYEKATRILVNGGTFIAWLHDDPTRADLQIDVRTGAVTSERFDLTAGLELVRGEDRKIFIIFRDGARVLDTVPDAIRLTARKGTTATAPELFRVAWDVDDVETLAAADRAFVTITPSGRVIDAIFAAYAGTTDQAAAAVISGSLEIPYSLDGITRTPAVVPITIREDLEQ